MIQITVLMTIEKQEVMLKIVVLSRNNYKNKRKNNLCNAITLPNLEL